MLMLQLDVLRTSCTPMSKHNGPMASHHPTQPTGHMSWEGMWCIWRLSLLVFNLDFPSRRRCSATAYVDELKHRIREGEGGGEAVEQNRWDRCNSHGTSTKPKTAT